MHNLAIQHQIHICLSHTSKVTKMSSINERTTCLFYFLFSGGGGRGCRLKCFQLSWSTHIDGSHHTMVMFQATH